MDERADVVIVDTRPENAYKKGHIARAVNFPWKETIGEPVDLPRNRLLVLYCDCTDEATSLDLARQLIREWGYRNVKVLESGLDGWIRLGIPCRGCRERAFDAIRRKLHQIRAALHVVFPNGQS